MQAAFQVGGLFGALPLDQLLPERALVAAVPVRRSGIFRSGLASYWVICGNVREFTGRVAIAGGAAFVLRCAGIGAAVAGACMLRLDLLRIDPGVPGVVEGRLGGIAIALGVAFVAAGGKVVAGEARAQGLVARMGGFALECQVAVAVSREGRCGFVFLRPGGPVLPVFGARQKRAVDGGAFRIAGSLVSAPCAVAITPASWAFASSPTCCSRSMLDCLIRSRASRSRLPISRQSAAGRPAAGPSTRSSGSPSARPLAGSSAPGSTPGRIRRGRPLLYPPSCHWPASSGAPGGIAPPGHGSSSPHVPARPRCVRRPGRAHRLRTQRRGAARPVGLHRASRLWWRCRGRRGRGLSDPSRPAPAIRPELRIGPCLRRPGRRPAPPASLWGIQGRGPESSASGAPRASAAYPAAPALSGLRDAGERTGCRKTAARTFGRGDRRRRRGRTGLADHRTCGRRFPSEARANRTPGRSCE